MQWKRKTKSHFNRRQTKLYCKCVPPFWAVRDNHYKKPKFYIFVSKKLFSEDKMQIK